MLREYLISEALYQLKIPTTRSLSVATTGREIIRETRLPGAILTRVARSHIRIGTFQWAITQGTPSVKTLLDYTISRHTPHLKDSDNIALDCLQAVMLKQIDLITQWMRVGFIHGVMNTDNMTLSGETLDYGPCAFMDHYHPETVFSSIDRNGRYAYSHQPQIAHWNIARLAETLLPLIDDNKEKAIQKAQDTLKQFYPLYEKNWLSMMRQKCGLLGSYKEDQTLISDLLNLMQNHHADFTNTFYDLTYKKKLQGGMYEQKDFKNWYERWKLRIKSNPQPLCDAIQIMKKNNPVIIPRNHHVEYALQQTLEGHMTPFQHLLKALTHPYQENPRLKVYQKTPSDHERITPNFCGT